MNIQISDSNCQSQTNARAVGRKTSRVHTIALHHLQAQDLVDLEDCSNAPAAFFQKRDRSLKNPVYSILALDASMTVSITDDNVRLRLSNGSEEQIKLSGCPFDFLSSLNAMHADKTNFLSSTAEIAFASGMIGYLGFGTVSQIEKIEKQSANPIGVPDSRMMVPQTIVYIDHSARLIHVISRANAQRFRSIVELIEKLNATAYRENRATKRETEETTIAGVLTASMSKSEFLDKARQAKALIEEGQCFQIVLSQRFSGKTNAKAATMFTTLLETAPSTYNYFLNFSDFQYIGASPETMVSAKNGQVRLCALAGTRPRGSNPVQDNQNEVELKNNEKELAEHLMLVDLGRNDLGKVCVPGSIKVGPVAQVLKYSNVMHLGTEIFGTLESDKSSFTALKSCFPRGTVSGAPKVRALELLSKLEPEQRGIYAGAVGFFDDRGGMDTAIAIRSALIKDGEIHINAGAGIVYDSEPEFEYQETINKASAIASVFQQVQSAPRHQDRLPESLPATRAGAR
jgi:anthranilate synthase component I